MRHNQLTKKRWPRQGELLMHRFRNGVKAAVAKVIEVDKATNRVVVELGGKTFQSLTAAAEAVTGNTENGWLFWGLRKQKRTSI